MKLLSMKSIHFPDIILIDKENNTIKIAEVKSSGENDSTSVPGNINKLVEGKNHYAGKAWENTDVLLLKSISIAAAKKHGDNNYHYPVRNRWEKVINENNYDIQVCVNEEIIHWLTNCSITFDDYFENVISTACRIEALLMNYS